LWVLVFSCQVLFDISHSFQFEAAETFQMLQLILLVEWTSKPLLLRVSRTIVTLLPSEAASQSKAAIVFDLLRIHFIDFGPLPPAGGR
jgi:hypothetical protein